MRNSYRSIGLATLVIMLLSGLAGLSAQAKSAGEIQSVTGKRNPPGFTFTRTPLSIRQHYYDYMIGGFNNLPLQAIPQSEGGGYFLTYHGRTQPISNRRVFYSYLDGSGNLVNDNYLSGVDTPEGYSDVAVDPVSGKPMYVWHANADADPQLEVVFKADAFIGGLAGLFSEVQTVIDNPISITAPDGSTTTDNQFVWPSIAIGPSPFANRRRVYVLARNSTSHNAGQAGNVYLAYADFSTGDLENGTPMDWSYTSIPEIDAWNVDNMVSRRPSGSLATDAAGNIYYAGYHSSSVAETDLDIYKCGNFGEGTWSRITSSSIMPSWNPPSGPGSPVGYFTNDGGTPYADAELNWKIYNSGHLNASLDANGRVHFPALWALTAGEDIYFPGLQFVKSAVYDPVLNELEIKEIFPQKNPADTYNSCYTPWDLEAPWGEVDEWGYDPEYGYYPVFTTDWPFPHWDQSAHEHTMMFHYNNLKITQANEQGLMAAVWQDSQASMNDNNGSADILISISPNNGYTWLEPIVLNGIDNPQLAGMRPMWVYPADRMIYQGIGDGWKWAKLGLMFYDDYTWGANVLSPPYHPNIDGGELMFMELSIAYQYVGYETVADPVIAPWGGTFDQPVYVALSTPTSGATIRYTLDGSVPDYLSPVYSEPLYLDANTVLNAFATLSGYDPSSVVSAQFYFQVADPDIQPEAGVYTEPVDVTMSCSTPNAQIRYTLDGSEPDAGSDLYSGPLNLALDSAHVIKARAFYSGWLPSASVAAEYLITGELEAPVINPPSGTYYLPIQVSIATPLKNVQIRYTLDGSEPDETSSALYTTPLSISQNTTLKARAFRANWQSSPSTEAVYGFPAYSTGVRKIYPNPFAGSLHIEMGIKEADQKYKLAIYNLKGERVFDFEGQEQGVFQYHWDGRDRNGKRLAAGLYLLRFSSGTKVQTSKIMLMGAGRK